MTIHAAARTRQQTHPFDSTNNLERLRRDNFVLWPNYGVFIGCILYVNL